MGQGANVCHGPHDGSSVTVHSGTGDGLHGCTGKDSRVESSVDRDRLSISCCPTTCVQMDHCVLFYGTASLPGPKGCRLLSGDATRRDGRTSVYKGIIYESERYNNINGNKKGISHT